MANGEGLLGGFLPAQGSGVQGILGSPAVNLGLGLMAAGGPSRQPVSLGQALGQGVQFAQNAEQQNLRNQLLRQGVQQRAQQQEAQGRLGELFQPGTVGVGTVDPQTGIATVGPEGGVQAPGAGLLRAGGIQSPEVMGLLAQAAPEQFAGLLAQQIFPEQRRPNSLIEQAQFAFPDDPEQQRQFVATTAQRAGAGEDQIGQMIDMMRLQQLQMDLQTEQDERVKQGLEKENAVRQGVSRLQELTTLNDQLQSAAEQTGLSVAELGAMATGGPLAQRAGSTALTQAFGLDPESAQTVLGAAQRFDQLTSREALDALARNPALGQGTNSKLRAVFETKPGFDRQPSVNNRIIADALSELLGVARTEGITLDQRRRLEQRIQELRGREEPPTGGGGSGVIDFNALPE